MCKWIRRILLFITFPLLCTVSVLADEQPKESREDASESFWEYELHQDRSALNEWASAGEDMANLNMINPGKYIETAKDAYDLFTGANETYNEYVSPMENDPGLWAVDEIVRICNESPLIVTPHLAVVTVTMDYLNYTEKNPEKNNAVAEFIKGAVDYTISWVVIDRDIRNEIRKDASEHWLKGQFMLFKDIWDLMNWLSNKVPNGTNALKPNIYLYGEPGTEIGLTFTEEELLLTVLPDYQDSWNVQIAEDGSLTVDGEEGFPYLFYESATIPAIMQKETGFVITPENRASQLEQMMTAYGFNETETADFVDYWDAALDKHQTFYVFPQETETVDLAMPLALEGTTIDSYDRIWFYFVPEDLAEEPEPPEIHPVEHEGTCLIEWGVVKE